MEANAFLFRVFLAATWNAFCFGDAFRWQEKTCAVLLGGEKELKSSIKTAKHELEGVAS